jgi:malate dehydrogenase (oxaloacetate-decarboxylating)
VLAFPGIFRGAHDVRATAITEAMELAAAQALADVVPLDHLEADYVLPSVLDRSVAPAIAAAVAQAAVADGVSRIS